MTTLSLTARNERLLMDNAEFGVPDVESLQPGIMEPRDVLEPLRGIGRAGAKTAGVFNQGVYALTSPYTEMLDRMLGTELKGFSEDILVQSPNRISRSLAPDPAVSGLVGQTLNQLFDVGSTFLAGTVMGGPGAGAALVGATTGRSSYYESRDRGVDPVTAGGKAAFEGLLAAAGARLPASFGGNVIKNTLVYGPGINVTQGIASRGFVSDWLEHRGYPEIAAEYRPFDIQALAVDVVLGGLFGAVGARFNKPEMMDTALAAHENLHLELDTAPGVPLDNKTRNVHVKSVIDATESLLRDEPVNVEGTAREMNFESKPKSSIEVDAIVKALDEAGFAAEARELDSLKKELEKRGLTDYPDAEESGPPKNEPSINEVLKKKPNVDLDNPDTYIGKKFTSKDGRVFTLEVVRKGAASGEIVAKNSEGKDIGHTDDTTDFTKGFVGMIHVQDDWKGQGVGTALYEAARALTKDKKLWPSANLSEDAFIWWARNYPNRLTQRIIDMAKNSLATIKRNNGSESDMLASAKDNIASEQNYVKAVGNAMLSLLEKRKFEPEWAANKFKDSSVKVLRDQIRMMAENSEATFPEKKPTKRPETRMNKIPVEAPDGTQSTASKAMAEADGFIKKAEDDSKAYGEAIKCFLGES